MTRAQRIIAIFFALILLFVSFGFGSSGEQGTQALAALLAAMGLTLWALMRNKRDADGKERTMDLVAITPNEVAKILQNMGYKGKVSGEGNSWIVESSAEGSNFLVILYETSGPDSPATSLQIRAAWSLDDGVNEGLLPVCAKFNENWRYAKASVNDKAIALEWDIYAKGGASSEQMDFALSTFITLMSAFINEVRQVL